MNTAPKYPVIKRLTMPESELRQQLLSYQARLWNHLAERNANNVNHSYVDMLERNIADIKAMLQPVTKAA